MNFVVYSGKFSSSISLLWKKRMGMHGLDWFGSGTSGRLLWKQWWTFGFHKIWGNVWI